MWAERPIPESGIRAYVESAVDHPAHSNVDLLAWFSEDEREVCLSCGEHACVSLPDAFASFCLACGAVLVDGVRIDADLHVAS